MSIANLVLLVGASQGLLLSAVIVFLRSANALANRFLAVFVGFESLHLLWLFLIYLGAADAPPAVLRLLFVFRVLGAPALFLYVCTMTASGFRLKAAHWLHLLIVLPLLSWWLYLVGQDEWLRQPVRELQLLPSTVWVTMYVSLGFIGYGLAALHRLGLHTRRLEQALSSTESISLWWLRAIIALMVAANLLGLAMDVLRLQQMIGPELRIWTNLATTLLIIYLISFGGLRQPAVFTESVSDALAALDEDTAQPAAAPDSQPGKYRKSGLHEQRIGELWGRLQDTLVRDELYLGTSLDLPTLARALDVRPQELSQVINTAGNGSFYELINDYRVEAAKRLLSDPATRNRKLFDIAISAGFSSQSTFYSQFKKRTGMTPSAYRHTATPAEENGRE